ncbi:Na+/H+ antiporter NhaC family protein [Fusibacter bizertensis]
MSKQIKTYVLIFVLLASVSLVILVDQALYKGIALTCAIGFFLVSDKVRLPNLIIANTKSVYKTMLLMFLISITLPVLMAAGVLPTLIYHVSQMMLGGNLLLAAFVISTFLSMILGSAIGTLTILLPLFSSIAIQSGIFYPWVIGALISGVYIGDRCSPLSSGLHLLSSVTETNYLKNMRYLLISAILPFLMTTIILCFLGGNALITKEMIRSNDLLGLHFDIALWRLIPLVLMVILLLMKQPITRVLVIVFALCSLLAIPSYDTIGDFVSQLYNGYQTSDPALSNFIKTSGFKQMINVILVIFFSGILNSLLEADHLIGYIIEPFVKKAYTPRKLLTNTALLSIVLSMVTCSQAMTSMINGKYLSKYYDNQKIKREFLVLMTANAGLNVVALIPWNVNGIMLKQLTGVAPLEYLPFSFFVLILTLLSIVIYPIFIQRFFSSLN